MHRLRGVVLWTLGLRCWWSVVLNGLWSVLLNMVLLLLLLLLVHGMLIQFRKTGLGLFIHFLDLIPQSTVIPVHHHSNRHCGQCGHGNHTTKLGRIHR